MGLIADSLNELITLDTHITNNKETWERERALAQLEYDDALAEIEADRKTAEIDRETNYRRAVTAAGEQELNSTEKMNKLYVSHYQTSVLSRCSEMARSIVSSKSYSKLFSLKIKINLGGDIYGNEDTDEERKAAYPTLALREYPEVMCSGIAGYDFSDIIPKGDFSTGNCKGQSLANGSGTIIPGIYIVELFGGGGGGGGANHDYGDGGDGGCGGNGEFAEVMSFLDGLYTLKTGAGGQGGGGAWGDTAQKSVDGTAGGETELVVGDKKWKARGGGGGAGFGANREGMGSDGITYRTIEGALNNLAANSGTYRYNRKCYSSMSEGSTAQASVPYETTCYSGGKSYRCTQYRMETVSQSQQDIRIPGEGGRGGGAGKSTGCGASGCPGEVGTAGGAILKCLNMDDDA
jgi:hypothetical protein